MLIDAVVSRLTGGTLTYDAGGSLAMSGRPDKVVLGQLMSHPFLEKRPPKSVGRGEFGMEFADEILARYPDLSLEDMVATVTAFVVRSISRSCGRWLPGTVDDIIVGGGGARNPALMKMISDAFPRAKLYTCEDFGIGNDAKDALAFGLLASETMHMQPGNVPSATGAKRRVVLGKIAPGRNYQALVDRIAGREERGSK
jgi:anhydro-N-acetylmuramic acid kinase